MSTPVLRRVSAILKHLRPSVGLKQLSFGWREGDKLTKYWESPAKVSESESAAIRGKMTELLESEMKTGNWVMSSAKVMSLFNGWMQLVGGHPHVGNGNAMCVSTIDSLTHFKTGAPLLFTDTNMDNAIDSDSVLMPSARMLLLKLTNDDLVSFVFFTNHLSRKGAELAEMNTASLCFHWDLLGACVRVQGVVSELQPEVSDEYWAARPPLSQLCSATSAQSRNTASRQALDSRLAALRRQHTDAGNGQLSAVKRPLEWAAFQVVATSVEFWQGSAHRWHRRLYARRSLDSAKRRKEAAAETQLECDLWTACILQP